MKLLQTRILAAALAATLAAAGCGKRQSDAPPNTSDSPALATADLQQSASALEPSLGAMAIDGAATNAATPSGEFMTTSMAGPFAASDTGSKETYDRALIAFQIGDYARAARELQDLAGNSKLTSTQKEAVQNLLMQTLKLAPDLTATNKPPHLPGR
jgi:hypothetical protein